MAPKRVKQTPRNAFYYFILDFKSRQGRKFNSMQEASLAAGPYWSAMSKEQRRPYEEKALYEKNNIRPGKYTSEGLDVEVLEKLQKEEQDKIEEMKEYINQDIKMAERTRRLHRKMFFIIHINQFCFCTTENRYYPAEIGISAFNLVDGISSDGVFHRIIKPGVLPLGYASEAKLHSKETHQIPPPLSDDIENNMEEVFSDMKIFLQSKMQGSERMPILYCNERFMKMIQQILDTWCIDYNDDYNRFYVYNLQYMFRILRNTAAKDNVWATDTFSDREIEKDVYAYAVGICCGYHESSNVGHHCSKSIATRYAYTICDNCCTDLQIELTPGTHLPATAFTKTVPSRPSSAASFSSSKSSRSRASNSSFHDDDSDSVMSFSSKSDWENQSVVSETSEATISLQDDEDFPTLGKGKRNQAVKSPPSWTNFTPNDSSSVASQPSLRSYAGATGTSGLSKRPAEMPSSIRNSMEKLSVNSSKSSDFASGNHGIPKKFDNGMNDFPALGRGKNPINSKGRGIRRPNDER